MRKVPAIIALIALGAVRAIGQESTPEQGMPVHATLTVSADRDTVRILLDGIERGFAPVTLDSLAAGKHYVRGIPSDIEQWLAQSTLDSVVLAPGEAGSLHLHFNRWYSLVTVPAGANVYAGDSLLGVTPLVLPAERVPAGDSVLVVKKEGYEHARIQPGRGPAGGLLLTLQPRWGSEGGAGSSEQWRSGSSPLRLYLTGGTAVLAGAAAAYFKIQADNKNNELRRTGDPALQSEVHRLDTASAVALVVSQAGILLFSYFLLSE